MISEPLVWPVVCSTPIIYFFYNICNRLKSPSDALLFQQIVRYIPYFGYIFYGISFCVKNIECNIYIFKMCAKFLKGIDVSGIANECLYDYFSVEICIADFNNRSLCKWYESLTYMCGTTLCGNPFSIRLFS